MAAYLRSLKWFHIPVGVGLGYLCFQQYGHIREREKRKILTVHPAKLVAKDWQVNLLTYLPTRLFSRVWGQLADMKLPVWFRRPLFGLYVYVYSCDMNEAEISELSSYQTVNSFFTRQLKSDARPVNEEHELVSPCDGRILHFGVVDETGCLEQVKGVTYPLGDFVGPIEPKILPNCTEKNSQQERLYFCTLYLGPGDCHHFHSPAKLTFKERRQFPGALLSVAPSIARFVQGLFTINERVVLLGQWQHGFFCFAAVGAYNVGSIHLAFDQDLVTNKAMEYQQGDFIRNSYTSPNSTNSQLMRTGKPVQLAKGDHIGWFSLGSTIILIFAAPKNFEFTAQSGDRVLAGHPLGRLQQKLHDG